MHIVYIKLRNCCQACYVDINEISVEPNTYYIIETEHGTDIGCTCKSIKLLTENEAEKNGKILKVATDEDIKKLAEIISLEKRAYNICRNKIFEKKLEMKLVSVKSLFDKTKIIFYFVAENRIDFRELVRDLAAIFKIRIEMRQIGVRDETKIIGGFGLCGRELCCMFLNDGFDPVSIKMAKEQNLNLNSLKISGMCGRLLCCLSYEYNTYKELNKGLPFIDTEIDVGEKVYKVISIDTLKGIIRLKNDTHVIDICNMDIQKKENKYYISEDVMERITNSHIKDSYETNDLYRI